MLRGPGQVVRKRGSLSTRTRIASRTLACSLQSVTKATDPPGQVALLERSKEVFVGHPKVSADFNPKLQRSSGCFKGVSPLKGINNALFQVPSSSQFQFPDVLEAEFRLDPEFRQRVVGLERMLRVRDSLQAKSACAAEQELNDSVSEVGSGHGNCAFEPECDGSVFEVGSGPRCVSENDFHDAVSELGSGQGDCSAYGVHRQLDVTVGERVRNLHLRKTGFVESDFSTDRVWSSAAQMGVAGLESSLILHATAEERSGVISLLQAPESEFSEAARTASAAAASGESVEIIGSRICWCMFLFDPRVISCTFMRGCW